MADGSNHFYYYIYNLQGDVIALADASTGTYTYDAWGKIVKISGQNPEDVASTNIANISPFRYRGYYYDTETSLYYLNSRYYDPDTGRFLSPDKYTTTGQGVIGNNMFAYCNNNPIQYKDDNGDFCIQTAIIGGAINAGVSIMCSIFDAAESITSGIVSTELSGLRKVGKWIWNTLFGSRNKSAVNPRREVRIHAFGV